LFRLAGQPDEYVEFDTSALMRSNFKERMEGWAIATKSGIAINEFRNAEGFPSKAFGDEPRVQQQMVPLSYGAEMKPPQPGATPAPAPPPPSDPQNNAAPDADQRGYDDFMREIDDGAARESHSVH
jgi:hypothetical protein